MIHVCFSSQFRFLPMTGLFYFFTPPLPVSYLVPAHPECRKYWLPGCHPRLPVVPTGTSAQVYWCLVSCLPLGHIPPQLHWSWAVWLMTVTRWSLTFIVLCLFLLPNKCIVCRTALEILLILRQKKMSICYYFCNNALSSFPMLRHQVLVILTKKGKMKPSKSSCFPRSQTITRFPSLGLCFVW